MIDIRERGILGHWNFFYITEQKEQDELKGISDQIVCIVLGYADPVEDEQND